MIYKTLGPFSTPVTMLNAHKFLLSHATHNETRKSLRSQLTRRLKHNQEYWRKAGGDKIETTVPIDDNRNLYLLINGIGPCMPDRHQKASRSSWTVREYSNHPGFQQSLRTKPWGIVRFGNFTDLPECWQVLSESHRGFSLVNIVPKLFAVA